jgi:X-X-X-Leu-X-X-Gly heptad repeat protein
VPARESGSADVLRVRRRLGGSFRRSSGISRRVGSLPSRIGGGASSVRGSVCGLTGGISRLAGGVSRLRSGISSLVSSVPATAATRAEHEGCSEGAKSKFDLHLGTPKKFEGLSFTRLRQTKALSR